MKNKAVIELREFIIKLSSKKKLSNEHYQRLLYLMGSCELEIEKMEKENESLKMQLKEYKAINELLDGITE